MGSLAEHIAKFICAEGINKKYLLAYSGGLDSHVLLHIFAELRSSYSYHLSAIHINHSINSHAEQWTEHCAKVCAELNINFITRTLSISHSNNLEEQLRQHRYQLLENSLEANAVLLTAHHQNDQAETILLQLCRGAGVSGLAAMPRIKPFGLGFHARPLLDFTREDLLQYANDHQLKWIEDESNNNSQFTRNFLRHEILPLLSKRWPTVTQTLARSAGNCADAQQFIEMSAQQLLKNMQGTISGTLSVKKILLLNQIEQRHVLRAWIDQAKFLMPSTTKMQQILQTLLHARADKMPHVSWGNVEIRRYRDNLFIMPQLTQHDTNQVIPWDLSQPLILPGIGKLEALSGHDLKNVTVQFRKGGEMLCLPGRKHHHELKKVFQMWGVLPWLRDRIPLVYKDDTLISVVGYWIAEEFRASDNLEALNITLREGERFFYFRLP